MRHGSPQKKDNQNLAIFERIVLREIFGPKKDQNTGTYEKKKNQDPKNI